MTFAHKLAAPLRGLSIARILTAVQATAETWSRRRRGRRALGDLSDHLLQDIGLDRFTAEREAERPCWKD